MAEPTCVILPFSYNIQQETQVCNYGEEEEEEGSVSFGRFMSENLAWERWSSFNSNRNRYVEEAEMYSRPGSVAQKKAYFEAHFKRMAALKAAALLETGIGSETGVDTTIDHVKDCGVNVEIVEVHDEGVEGFVVHQNELYSEVLSSNEEDLGDKMVEKNEVLKDKDCMESNVIPQMEKTSMQRKRSLKEQVSTQQHQLCKSVPLLHGVDEVSTQQQLPKSVPLLQNVDEVSTQQQLPKSVPLLHNVDEVSTQQQLSKSVPLLHNVDAVSTQQQLRMNVPLLHDVDEASTQQQLPKNVPLLHNVDEVSTQQVPKSVPLLHNVDEVSTRQQLRMNVPLLHSVDEVSTQQQLPKSVSLLDGVEEISTQQLPKSVPLLHVVEEISTQQLPKSVSLLHSVEEISTQQLPEKVPLLQGVEQISTPLVKKNPPLSSFMSPLIHPGKENYATPVKNKSSSIIADQDHKKRTPLRASINREFNRIISPVIRKIGSSSSNKTPSKGSENGPPLTPDTTKRGARTPRSRLDSSAGERKPAGPRWHILSESISGGFKSPRSNKNKTSSPIIPTSFCLGSGERATRRKQNLEDKFNATTTEKVPQPSKFKEKAEAELNKLRQSFCFKVMSSHDHYREGELQYKNESTRRELPKPLGKQQSSSSTSQSRSSLPPRRPTVVKPSSLKTVTERNSISNK